MTRSWYLLFAFITTVFAACEETFLVTCDSLFDLRFNKSRSKWTELQIQSDKYSKVPPKYVLDNTILDSSFTNLRWLIIVGQVKTLKPGAFIYLDNIQHLILYGNNINTIYPETFVNSYNSMEQISLKKNNITAVKEKAFHTCNAKIIDLSYNRIKVFHMDWLKSSTTEKLVLSHNHVEIIKKNKEVPPLKYLHLNHNNLNYIPSVLTDLSCLEYLSISHNRLYSIRKLSKLKNLTKVDLSFNYIEEVSEEFDELPKLQYLDLSHNELKKFTFTATLVDNLGEYFGVFLAYNKLRNLNLHEFGSRTSVAITLAGNPWHCRCYEQLLMVMEKSDYSVYNTICDRTLLDGIIPCCVETGQNKCSSRYDLSDELFNSFQKATVTDICDVSSDLDDTIF